MQKLCLGVCDRRQCPCARSCSGIDRISTAAWVEQEVVYLLSDWQVDAKFEVGSVRPVAAHLRKQSDQMIMVLVVQAHTGNMLSNELLERT